jgi:DNA-binding Lrp family transcriptional regulator
LTDKKIAEIKKELQKVINDIGDNTDLEPVRTLEEVSIEIGEAPEQYETFGVERTEKKIIFGEWLNQIKPEYTKRDLWGAVIVREAFSFFFDEGYLFNAIGQLTNIFLNILAISYEQENKSEAIGMRAISSIKNRLRLSDIDENKQLLLKIWSVLDEIIKQNITSDLVLNTYVNFLKRYPKEDIDIEEIIDDFSLYLSSSSEEIAAPIYLKEIQTRITRKLVEKGYRTSAIEIANELGINQATVSRHLKRLDSRFYAKWRAIINWEKIGLHDYEVIIRFDERKKGNMEILIEELLNIKYIYIIYKGQNNKYNYLFASMRCPHIISNNLENKLKKYKNRNLIKSFDVKQIIKSQNKITIINERIKPTIENYQAIIEGKIPIERITLWETSNFKDSKTEKIDDKNTLYFLSIIKSNSIVSFSLFGCWLKETEKLLLENNNDMNNNVESTNFLNKLETVVMEKNLLDYYLLLAKSNIASNYLFIVFMKPDNGEDFQEFIENISIFGTINIRESFNDVLLIVHGPKYNDDLVKLLKKKSQEKGIESEIFSVIVNSWRFIPYHDLYSFKNKKWLIY